MTIGTTISVLATMDAILQWWYEQILCFSYSGPGFLPKVCLRRSDYLAIMYIITLPTYCRNNNAVRSRRCLRRAVSVPRRGLGIEPSFRVYFDPKFSFSFFNYSCAVCITIIVQHMYVWQSFWNLFVLSYLSYQTYMSVHSPYIVHESFVSVRKVVYASPTVTYLK